MKPIGIKQFHEKKYSFLGFKGEWQNFIGDPAINFVGIIYGESGQGKTECAIRFAKYLCNFGQVAWISYEQGHDYDLQKATKRNKMEEETGKFIPIDPHEKRKKSMSLWDELDEYLSKRNSAKFIFIDSVDYLEPTLEQYKELKRKHGGKKGIIFLSHEKNGKPELHVAKKIAYDGKLTLRVYKYIARNKKNRLGGKGNYLIWEEEARRLDPLFFRRVEAGEEDICNLKMETENA